MDLGMRGRSYLVVGGTAGMGLATAKQVAAEGADVVVVGRNQHRGRAALEAIEPGPGAAVHAVGADIGTADGAERMVAEAIELTGGLDGIAVCTGVLGHIPLTASDEEWTAAFNDVLLGTTRSVRAVLPHLVERGGGTIVTVAAYGMRSPAAERIAYGSLKAGVAVLTKGVAKTYGRQGIRANCVCPGAIETEVLHSFRQVFAEQRGYPYEEALERVMVEDWNMQVALGRPGQPTEVGELITFLLSPRAGYLTGALINIDGGTDF